MTTHQHPITLVQRGWLVTALIGATITWLLCHPHALVSVFHLTSTTPGLWAIDMCYGQLKPDLLAVAIGLPFCCFATTYTWWLMSTYTFERNILTYQFGPFNRNSMPSGKIQDVRCEQDPIGALLGYGTLVVDAGRAEQRLPFLPDVKTWQDAILHAL